MSPIMDDMYNQLYMLPDGQHFYVTKPTFSLMLGHGDIFSVSSYSLATMKKMKQQFSSNQMKKKNNFWKYIFFSSVWGGGTNCVIGRWHKDQDGTCHDGTTAI